MNSKMITLSSLMIVSVVFAGCGLKRTAYNQRNFVLEAQRERPQREASKDAILNVKDFSIDIAFSGKSLVYRKGQSEYETDFYNQFLINPDDMITEKTRSWLSQSGLFEWVLEQGSYMEPTYVLEGNITALYGDFRDALLPKATMEIRLFLVELPENSIVSGKTYKQSVEVASQTAEAVIEAFDECLINILSELEEDLEGQL